MSIRPDSGAESCGMCGGTLEYLNAAATLRCTVCGREDRGHVVCPQGHYLCESCHGAGFMERLPTLLDESRSVSPFVIAEELMAQPDLPMLGCEHAYVAAGALMRALENAGVPGVTAAHRAEVLERTGRQAVSAYCGLSGACGVVPALGACYSVLVGGQCGKGPETRAAMTLVSRLAAATAAEADPGCCKAYVRSGLRVAAVFLKERLGIVVEPPLPVVCTDAERHPHDCRGAECAWHEDHEESAVSDTEPSRRDPSERTPGTGPAAKAGYDEFFERAYAAGVLDRKTKILVALGASLASGCAP
ncbi:MAG: DUF5714 domain-containing protein [Thermoleophilia bacterium]